MNPAFASRTLVARLAALSDPTRLRLLRLLERRELGVAELCDAVQLPQSTVSRHLKVLADQGWVAAHRQGASNLYRMTVAELDSGARGLWRVIGEQAGSWPAMRQDELRLARRLRRRIGDSRAFFARTAARWDELREQLYGRRFTEAAALSLAPPEWVVADLGCGAGRLAVELAGRFRRVIGVDHSTAMLAVARRRTAELTNVELREGDLQELPLPRAGCDAALMILALTYVADPPAALAEMARILRGGGRAVLVDLVAHDRRGFQRDVGHQWPGFEPAVCASWLAAAGLTEVRVRLLPPEPQVKGPALFLATGRRASTGASRFGGGSRARRREEN